MTSFEIWTRMELSENDEIFLKNQRRNSTNQRKLRKTCRFFRRQLHSSMDRCKWVKTRGVKEKWICFSKKQRKEKKLKCSWLSDFFQVDLVVSHLLFLLKIGSVILKFHWRPHLLSNSNLRALLVSWSTPSLVLRFPWLLFESNVAFWLHILSFSSYLWVSCALGALPVIFSIVSTNAGLPSWFET